MQLYQNLLLHVHVGGSGTKTTPPPPPSQQELPLNKAYWQLELTCRYHNKHSTPHVFFWLLDFVRINLRGSKLTFSQRTPDHTNTSYFDPPPSQKKKTKKNNKKKLPQSLVIHPLGKSLSYALQQECFVHCLLYTLRLTVPWKSLPPPAKILHEILMSLELWGYMLCRLDARYLYPSIVDAGRLSLEVVYVTSNLQSHAVREMNAFAPRLKYLIALQ